jgi:hypothetical protein
MSMNFISDINGASSGCSYSHMAFGSRAEIPSKIRILRMVLQFYRSEGTRGSVRRPISVSLGTHPCKRCVFLRTFLMMKKEVRHKQTVLAGKGVSVPHPATTAVRVSFLNQGLALECSLETCIASGRSRRTNNGEDICDGLDEWKYVATRPGKTLGITFSPRAGCRQNHRTI